MQLFLTPAPSFPASVLNTENFQAVLGISSTLLRGGLAAIFMTATFGLLHRFDAAMRHEATRIAQHASNALRVSEARLSDIFKMSPEAIIVTDESGCITMFSAGAQAIFGYSEDEMIGRGIASLLPERFRTSHRFRVSGPEATPGQNIVKGGDGVGLRRNGEEFPMEASVSALSMPDGVTLTTILRDTSRQKAVHDELLNA
jgi:PAS domain S-box-containing protein